MPSTIQPSFAAGELAPALTGRVDLAQYAAGAKTLCNMFVHASGGVSNRAGTRFLGQAPGAGRLIPFQFSVEQAYVLEFTDGKMRVYMDGGQVLDESGEPVEIVSPFALADLAKLRYVQSADTLFFAHPSYAPRKLTRSSHTAWTFSEVSFVSSLAAPSGVTASRNSVTASPSNEFYIYYKVTAVNKSGEESLPSAYGYLSMYCLWPSGSQITIAWTASSSAEIDHYNIYKKTVGQWGYIGASDGTQCQFVDDDITPSSTHGPPQANNPFESSNNPGAVGIYEQRMVYGRTDSQPQTVFLSKSGEFSNFNISTPLADDDAIEATIASQDVNQILHFQPLQSGLVVLTAAAEWIMAHGSNSDALTPSSIQFKRQGRRGSSDAPPLVVGETALYVQRGGQAVRDLSYQLASDSYTGTNLSILSAHLFDGLSIKEWAYQQTPDSIIWCVRSDGALLSFTYVKEQQIWAWARHETDGAFESVACIPGGDGEEDQVYFIVKRTVGGEAVRYVELLARRLDSDKDVASAFFVDSGLAYSGEAATTISGLDHLEGKTVAILADGNVVAPQAVADGAVKLPYAAERVHVGLPYEATLQTLPLALDSDPARLQGRLISVTAVTLRMLNTRGGFVGADENALTEIKYRSDEDYDEATRLFSGDKEIIVAPEWKCAGSIIVRQSDPLPISILAAIPKIQIGG